MHLLMMTRGIKQAQEMWEKFMQTQWFEFPQKIIKKDANGNFLKNPDGTYQYEETPKDSYVRVQGALRPIQLWEYVFPKECLHEVLAMQNLHTCFPLRPEVNNYSWILRKMTGFKKIPPIPEEIKKKNKWEITQKSVPMDGFAVYPLGIKDDVTQDFIFQPGNVGVYQEGL